MKVRKILLILLGIIGGLVFFWLFPLKLIARLATRFGHSAPCPASVAWLLDNPSGRRRAPHILDWVGIQPGEHVLELGPGPGVFTVEAARRVGPEGRLVAVDIQPEMLEMVEKRVRESGLTNVELHVADACALPLDDGSLDRAFLVTVLPEVPDQARALAELHRVLRPGGGLSISEHFMDPDYPFPCETIRRVEAAGFHLEEKFGNWWDYTLNFTSPATDTERARRLLQRAVPLLRLPTSPDQPPEVLPDGSGLRCPATGTVYLYQNGVLDLLGDDLHKTFTQHTLDTSLTAWFYDRFRGGITRALNSPDFPEEVAHAQQVLQAQAGDTILDLACGHGNFTVEWAKRVGPDGLVIGLDISPAMLARAVRHVRRWGLDNVLFIRGDAHHLPFVDKALPKMNCSGGFHQFPDLPQALREIARVNATGGVLVASTFAEGENDPQAGVKRWMKQRFDLHFVPLVWLSEQLATLGYVDYACSLPGKWFGYMSAHKT
ncbi:MAG: methyltransferase domain-containing protein [Chloroflexi bacterium]|nr:methyltransferase domain-containing protein [Chloroflexota bacterium]